jgi:hypothetical protein
LHWDITPLSSRKEVVDKISKDLKRNNWGSYQWLMNQVNDEILLENLNLDLYIEAILQYEYDLASKISSDYLVDFYEAIGELEELDHFNDTIFVLKDALNKGQHEIIQTIIESNIECIQDANFQYICNKPLFKYILDYFVTLPSSEEYFEDVFNQLVQNPVINFLLENYPQQILTWTRSSN